MNLLLDKELLPYHQVRLTNRSTIKTALTNGVNNIQVAAYNGARTVHIPKQLFDIFNVLVFFTITIIFHGTKLS